MSASRSTTNKSISQAEIVEAVKRFEAEIAAIDDRYEQEIAQWMRTQGFDPDKNCFLILPESRRADMQRWPKFVRFSAYIQDAMLMRDTMGIL